MLGADDYRARYWHSSNSHWHGYASYRAALATVAEHAFESGTIDVKALLAEDEEFLRALVRTALQEVLEAEMTEALGAEKDERATGRQRYRSGYYGRTLITRIGKLELRVPRHIRARRTLLSSRSPCPGSVSRMNLRPPKDLVQPTDAIPPIAIGFDNDLMLAGIIRMAVIFG